MVRTSFHSACDLEGAGVSLGPPGDQRGVRAQLGLLAHPLRPWQPLDWVKSVPGEDWSCPRAQQAGSQVGRRTALGPPLRGGESPPLCSLWAPALVVWEEGAGPCPSRLSVAQACSTVSVRRAPQAVSASAASCPPSWVFKGAGLSQYVGHNRQGPAAARGPEWSAPGRAKQASGGEVSRATPTPCVQSFRAVAGVGTGRRGVCGGELGPGCVAPAGLRGTAI